ncbi:MAG: right-handed parallel beta-helix repeat-containing protein [Bacteroidales bacterium]|nr:right-handed parallel beta-helix repeat-containing protein [Bacteroidales bacterium]
MKKRNLLPALIMMTFLLPKISVSESITVSGNVSGTWDVDTVKVIDDIYLREAETLLINPGVTVEFHGGYFFKVSGSLNALGSSSQPVHFTINDTIGFYNDTIPEGGWKGIRFTNQNTSVDSSVFNHCVFNFGKAVSKDSLYNYGGAICIRNSHKIHISRCIFENNFAKYNGGAVYLENANISLANNSFSGNRAGLPVDPYGYGGAVCSDWGVPRISKNIFYNNSSTGIGGGLCVRFSDCPVSHNIFDNNYSALGGGFGILHIELCHHTINNNLIINNGATYFGSGISNGDCSPTYVNNTIVDNYGAVGGFYCKDSVVPKLYNNIIWGNTGYVGEPSQVYLWDLLSQPDFYFNNIEGGSHAFQGTGGSAFSGGYENNLNDDPEFLGGTPFHFGLDDISPCINAGTIDTLGLMIPAFDIEGKARIVSGRIDIGAYENQSTVGIQPGANILDIFLQNPYPNPAPGPVEIPFYVHRPYLVNITVVGLDGRYISHLTNKYFERGLHKISWNLENGKGNRVGPGTYIIHLQVGKDTLEKKVVVN